jgi:DNA invertase Pin-like site-specific DNA recombinase
MRDAERYVAYYRVSTDKQGRSGLGLEAQKATVERFVGPGDEIVAEYVEVETGKGRDAFSKRPRLAAAVAECRRSKAKLLIAKLDRLARNVRFFLELMDSGIGVVICDLPETKGATGRFLLTNLAAVAELEAGMIGERTRAALAAAKARGTRLGNPQIHADAKAFAEGREAVFRAKYLAGIDLAAEIRAVREAGITGYREIAASLNAKGIPTPRGGKWHPSSVHRQAKRLKL